MLFLESITTNIFKGSSSGKDEIYVLKLIERGEYTSTYFSKEINDIIVIENDILKKYVRGEDIRRYIFTKKQRVSYISLLF